MLDETCCLIIGFDFNVWVGWHHLVFLTWPSPISSFHVSWPSRSSLHVRFRTWFRRFPPSIIGFNLDASPSSAIGFDLDSSPSSAIGFDLDSSPSSANGSSSELWSVVEMVPLSSGWNVFMNLTSRLLMTFLSSVNLWLFRISNQNAFFWIWLEFSSLLWLIKN